MTTRHSAATLLAAALLSSAGAKALPRAYDDHRATGCEAFGPDFRKIDGSDTCIRIGGAVRAELGISTGVGGARR